MTSYVFCAPGRPIPKGGPRPVTSSHTMYNGTSGARACHTPPPRGGWGGIGNACVVCHYSARACPIMPPLAPA